MSSLVSVIVPTFNRARHLPRAVDSALTQTHQNIEVIVLDDGSTDTTRQIITQRYAANPRVKYHHQPNAGVSPARNKALSLAQGDYFAFLDSDDYWYPWKIELQLAAMRLRPDVGMVWTNMVAINPDMKVIDPAYLRTMYHAWRHFSAPKIFGSTTQVAEIVAGGRGSLPALLASGEIRGDAPFHSGTVFSEMLMGNLAHTSTVLLHRERAALVKGFNIQLAPCGGDYDYHLRTCQHGPVGFIDLPTIQYQIGLPDRLTHPAMRLRSAVNCLKTVQPHFDGPPQHHLSREKVRERLGEIHGRIGELYFDQSQFAEARHHFGKALSYTPHCLRAWQMFCCTFLPAGVVERLRKSRRRRRAAMHSPAMSAAADDHDAPVDAVKHCA